MWICGAPQTDQNLTFCSICRGLSDGSVRKERCIEHGRPGRRLRVEEAEPVGEFQDFQISRFPDPRSLDRKSKIQVEHWLICMVGRVFIVDHCLASDQPASLSGQNHNLCHTAALLSGRATFWRNRLLAVVRRLLSNKPLPRGLKPDTSSVSSTLSHSFKLSHTFTVSNKPTASRIRTFDPSSQFHSFRLSNSFTLIGFQT